MRLPAPGPRRDLVLVLGLVLVAAAFRLPRLGTPAEEIFDEVYHAKSALQYLDGTRPIDWVHPPTAKLLIASGILVFGYEPWAWRLAPALAGVALAGVFFFFARRVLASERAALIATALLLTDGVYLVQSRVAMTNIFAVLFQVAAAWLVLRCAMSERPRAADAVLAGLAVGLALSTRWTSLWAYGFLGLVVLALRHRRLLNLRELFTWVWVFLLLPAGVYTLSYVPWMFILHPDTSFLDRLRYMILEQKGIWSYHADLKATHPYFSAWYTWPWLIRPTWYYFNGDGAIRGVIALGNPALWWLSLPVTLWAWVTGVRARDARRIFAAAGFCLLYLPWALVPRELNFSHYLFEAIPYACLSLGALLDRYWDGPGRFVARGFVAVAVALFLFFYPVLVAWPLPTSPGLGWHTWLRTWV